MRLLEEAREDNPAAESITRCSETAKGYRLGQSAGSLDAPLTRLYFGRAD